MKLLNLDKLGANTEERRIQVNGKSYVVDDMTVENFIVTTEAAEAISESDSMAVQVKATVEMIVRSVPTIDRVTLSGLKLESLKAIVAFIRGDDVEGVESSIDTDAEGDAGK